MTTPAGDAFCSAAEQAGVCDLCGRGLVVAFRQTAVAGHLQWSWSAPCAACGKALGDEGAGAAPQDIREAILAAEGEWTVALADPSRAAIAAIKALRAVYGLGLAEAKARWDGPAGLRGTRAEAEALHWWLRQDGVSGMVAFAGAAPPALPRKPAPAKGVADWAVAIPGGVRVAIAAIKAIRAAYGLGLKEAKDLWDFGGGVIPGTRAQAQGLAAELAAGGVACEIRAPGGQALPPAPPAEDWAIRVRDAASVGILAIREIRQAFGLGLKEAKDVWDRRAPGDELRDTRERCEALSARFRAAGIAHDVGPAPRT